MTATQLDRRAIAEAQREHEPIGIEINLAEWSDDSDWALWMFEDGDFAWSTEPRCRVCGMTPSQSTAADYDCVREC